MKKILLFLITVIFDMNMSAQTTNATIAYRNSIVQTTDKFLTVKGLELKPELKMDDALRHFENKGFRKSKFFDRAYSEMGIYTLTGVFRNISNCEISMIPTKGDKTIVGIIAIQFPNRESFKSLKNEYDDLKSALESKYYIDSSKESFDDPYIETSTSDYLKLNALEKDEAQFETLFYVNNDTGSYLLGEILLAIRHFTNNFSTEHYISLAYYTPDYIMEYLISYDDDI